jgi:hypothetical protein
MAHQYIQVPPDSTGKQVFNRVEATINYENGTIDFAVGDIITGASSGVTGEVILIEDGATTLTGTIHIFIEENSDVTFTGGENLQVSGVTNATMVDGSQTNYYVPVTLVAGGNSTAYQVEVDSHGSMSVRSDSGEFRIDGLGKLEVASHMLIAEYQQKYGKDNLINEETSGSATSTYDDNNNSVNMAVTTAINEYVYRQTHLYHLVPAGSVAAGFMILWHGDSGKTGNRRRWGYFDESNGAYFELDGTTVNAVLRTSNSGSVVEYRWPQAVWNLDTLDGDDDRENKSGHTLNLTKTNTFIIEFSGNGGIKWGIATPEGRVYVHGIAWSTIFSGAMWSDGIALPLRWEIENTAGTAGSSEMYCLASGVLANTETFLQRRGLGTLSASGAVSSTYEPIFSVRAAKRYNGYDNRSWLLPYRLEVYSDLEPVEVQIKLAATLTGSTFATSGGLAEWDTDAYLQTGGVVGATKLCAPGEISVHNHMEKDSDINPQSAKLHRLVDIDADPTTVTITAKSLTGAPTNVHMVWTWVELY